MTEKKIDDEIINLKGLLRSRIHFLSLGIFATKSGPKIPVATQVNVFVNTFSNMSIIVLLPRLGRSILYNLVFPLCNKFWTDSRWIAIRDAF